MGSAGVWTIPGLHASSDALRLQQHLGIDLSGHRTRAIVAPLLNSYDLILVMERGQREGILLEYPFARGKVFLLAEVVDQTSRDVADVLLPDRTAEEVASEICGMVDRGFDKICQQAVALHRTRT